MNDSATIIKDLDLDSRRKLTLANRKAPMIASESQRREKNVAATRIQHRQGADLPLVSARESENISRANPLATKAVQDRWRQRNRLDGTGNQKRQCERSTPAKESTTLHDSNEEWDDRDQIHPQNLKTALWMTYARMITIFEVQTLP